jgi:hypothetical protein
MRQNVRTVSDVIIHEVEEPLSSEKCSGGSEKSLKIEKEISSSEHYSEDLTVIGHTINVVVNAPCFCHVSTKKTSSIVATSSKTTTLVATLPNVDSNSSLAQIPLKQLRSDQCTSTSDLLERTAEPEEHQEQVQIDVDDDSDNDEEEDGQDTYSCSSVSSRSSRDPSCPRCFIIANTDCSKAVYV